MAKLAFAARLDHFGAALSLHLQASLEARLRDIKQRGRNKARRGSDLYSMPSHDASEVEVFR